MSSAKILNFFIVINSLNEDATEFMYMLGIHLRPGMLTNMMLEKREYEICRQCRNSKVTVEKEHIHKVIWDMTQEEWNRGNITLNELLKKGHVEDIECECDRCEATTTRYKVTTVSKAPTRLLIHLNRAVNMLDRNVANAAYYVHDEENYRDLITYPVTFPRVLEYNIKTLNNINSDNSDLFQERNVQYSLQGVICVKIQQHIPDIKCHYNCHCLNEDGIWVHYDDYESKDSELIDEVQDQFQSDTVTALFYKRMSNI